MVVHSYGPAMNRKLQQQQLQQQARACNHLPFSVNFKSQKNRLDLTSTFKQNVLDSLNIELHLKCNILRYLVCLLSLFFFFRSEFLFSYIHFKCGARVCMQFVASICVQWESHWKTNKLEPNGSETPKSCVFAGAYTHTHTQLSAWFLNRKKRDGLWKYTDE